MAECTNSLTYSYRVTLPIDSASPPENFFTITFFCNGAVFTSDELNTADDALEWAESILDVFGDWSLDGSTLILENSLCGVASLTYQMAQAPEGVELRLDSSSPEAIVDILGVSLVDVSVNGKRNTDTTWKTEMLAADFLFADPYADPTAQWYHLVAGGDGYNILAAEAIARGKTLATVLNGVGNKTYGYDFFEDDMAIYLPQISIAQAVLSINLASPLIQVIGTDPVNVGGIDFSRLYDEIAYFKATLLAQGVTIRRFQLCTEMGIQNQNDIIHSAADYKNVCAPVIVHLRATYPGVPISADAYEVDDETHYLDDYNETVDTMDVDGVRQYYQIFTPDYETGRTRIAELPQFLDEFQEQFPGKDLILQQFVVKTGNDTRLKVGEGLLFTEFALKIALENQKPNRNNLITDLSFYNATRLIAGNNTIYPAMKIIQLFRNVFKNDGKISYTFPGSKNLLVVPVKRGSAAEVYVLNPTTEFYQIDRVYLDNVAKGVTVSAYYGDTTSSEATQYTSTGNTVLLYPHSITKITTT